MTKQMVACGVGPGGSASHGPTWWVNHRFLPDDAIPTSGGAVLRSPFHDHTSLCGEAFSCLNAPENSKPDCGECERIAARMGASRG